ncbi:MAG: transglycosylase SLT domain-containing protein [candidate division KSB1 bacterium]|nr:transglycosylase SLT domain-containing protein [candidate division KSB1 bacterium]MDZ7341301.1 transglycosylase SLT domain-containing protein [candidate division KSB1 bacterium]
MILFEQQRKVIKTILLLVLILAIFITTVSFSHRISSLDETNSKLRDIENGVAHIRATVNLNNLYQLSVQRVIKIIEQYNPYMPVTEKYQIAEEIVKMSMKYSNLNVDLICATITHESALTWQKDIVSRAGAMGLMQIMPQTGEILAREEGIPWTYPQAVLFNPIYNIRLGCRYLSTLIDMYEVDGGLAAYNGGEKRAALWLKHRSYKTDWSILWEETRTYVPAVLRLYEKFQQETGVI